MAVTESTKTRLSKSPEYLHAEEVFAYTSVLYGYRQKIAALRPH